MVCGSPVRRLHRRAAHALPLVSSK